MYRFCFSESNRAIGWKVPDLHTELGRIARAAEGMRSGVIDLTEIAAQNEHRYQEGEAR